MTENNHLNEERATFKSRELIGDVSSMPTITQNVYRAKIFKSGNSLALRLPKALGLKEGTEMVISVEQGHYILAPHNAPKRKIDISGFAGKAPWLKPLPRELREFEERPSTKIAREAYEAAQKASDGS